jgi:hypothetical protein
MSSRKLSLADIADLRAYERERDEFRAQVIALKKRRRVHVGPFVTIVFENRDTIRFQIQEMARVERLMTDEAIQTELDIYNPLIPEPGSVAATLFIELTEEDQLRTWLPRLVGIETAVAFRVGAGDAAEMVRCVVDPAHARTLTRDDVTASVHYIHFEFSEGQVELFERGPATLLLDHHDYGYETVLGPDTCAELLADLRP